MPAHMRTVGSRRLVIELKQFREHAGLTGEQVAEQMGWSAAKVYRIEGDRVRVLARDVARLLKLYGITGEQADAMMELTRLARVEDWWQQYSGAIPNGSSSTSAWKPRPARCRKTTPNWSPGCCRPKPTPGP
jgi:transcriptional regulator with XRE-family HTH domain